MICPKCQKEIADGTDVCPICGAELTAEEAEVAEEAPKKPSIFKTSNRYAQLSMIIGVASIIFSQVVPLNLVGLLLGVWGLEQAKADEKKEGNGLAIAGIVAAIVLLWTKCEWFRNGVKLLWERVRSEFILFHIGITQAEIV